MTTHHDPQQVGERLQQIADRLRTEVEGERVHVIAGELEDLVTAQPQQQYGEGGEGRAALDRAWEESGRSALDELFEAVSPRDGSKGDPTAAYHLAPHAWAEVRRLRAASATRQDSIEEKRRHHPSCVCPDCNPPRPQTEPHHG